ncbi:hypothetical protein DL95DRAFT_427989 [Leptodontidium sp. 2 PMI_412]|nr:hypothetical protein DL95DRAFT_427989 [Leptodontidium sp. 2 PMI_412]
MAESTGVIRPVLDDDPDAIRLADDVLEKMANNVDNIALITQEANASTNFEKKMTIGQAIRMYPKAAFFALTLSVSLVIEGYETFLLGSFFGYPTFQEKFGHGPLPDGTYQLSASWQSGLQAGVGEILGLWAAGIIAERWGYKKTMIGSAASSVDGRGDFMRYPTLTTAYAAEVSPPALRPYLTTFNNMAWVIGQTISSGVLRGLLSRTDEWGWRIPYATQWVWPTPIIIGVLFAPESPWWLVRYDRIEDARKTLTNLVAARDTDCDVGNNLAMMIHTNEHDKAVSEGTSYRDCFTGVDLRRTEITCMVWIL